MAKVTKYRQDKYGSMILSGVSLTLIFMLALAAQVSGWQFYVWGLLVSYLWGEGMYARQPDTYGNAASRRLLFLFMGFAILFTIGFFTLILRNPEILEQYLGSPAP